MSGFAFGSKYVASLSTNNNTADEKHTTKPDILRSATIPPKLEGDISQQLQKLLKKDATTKAKALQSLQSAIQDKSPEAIELALPFWSYVYPKLLMDNDRSVRSEACLAMGKLGTKLGRRIAPYVKNIFPSWWLTSFDVHREVAHAAKSSLQLVFPNEKLKEAEIYTDYEIVALLTKLMASTPQSIGDARRETSEEMMERHQRMLAACCTAVASIASSSNNNNNNSIKRVVEEGSFIKNCLQSKSPVVRQHAYSLIATIATSCPLLLAAAADDDDTLLHKLAPIVFGSIGDTEPSTYSKLWEMVLSFSKAFPHSWDHVKPQKTVFPRLLSLLRHSCYGAPEVCLPAVLPFLGLLPPTVFPSPTGPFYFSLIKSILEGMGTTRTAQQAAADCVGDCTLYILLKRSGGESSSGWRDTLIDAWKETLFKSLFSSSSDNDDDKTVAMDVFKYLVAKLKQYQGWQLEAVVGAIAAGLLDNVMTSPSRVTVVVSTLAAEIPHNMGSRVIAQPLYDALKSSNSDASCSNEATLLLATLLRLYPEVNSADAQMQNLQLDGSSNSNTNTEDIIAHIIASRNDAQETVEANCQLLMSYIMNDKHGAAADFAQAVDAIYNLGTHDKRVVLHTLLKSAVQHHGSSLGMLQSAALDGIALQTGMDKVSLVYLLTGDGRHSLLTQQGQSSLLMKLSRSHSGADYDDKDAVSILVEVMFSPALNCGGYDAGSTAKQQLSALCFLTGWWMLPDTDEDSVSNVWRKVDDIRLLLASCSSDKDKHEFASRLGKAIQNSLVVESTPGGSYNTDSSKHLAEKINLILTTCSSDKAVQDTIMKTALDGVSFNLHIALIISYLLPLAGYEAVFPAADDEECARQIYNLLVALMESSTQEECVLSMIHNVLTSDTDTIMQQHILHLCIEATRHTNDNGGHVAIEEALLAHIVNTLISIDKVDALEQSVSVEQPEQLFDVVPTNAMRVILKEAAAAMRSVETTTAIISTLFRQLSSLYINNNNADQSILELAALCWPLKEASQLSFFNQQPSVSFIKGMQVWYTHRDGTREAAVIKSVDLTISPPSYAVQLGDNVRETVVERLCVQHHNDIVNSRGLGSSEPFPFQMHFSDEDKKILVEVLDNAMMMQSEDDAEEVESSQCALSDQLAKAHIMCAAVLYCSDVLIKVQWECIIEYHQQMMMMQAGPLIRNFIASAVKTARDAANTISGLEFDSSRAALHFLARLEVTGVLARSKKARECCEQAAAKIFRQDMSPIEDAMQMMQTVMLLGAAINQFAPQCRMLETLTVQQAVSSCCSTILDTFLSLGAFMGAAHCLGTTSQAEFQHWCELPRIAVFLKHLGIASHDLIAYADMEFLKGVVDKAAESCEALGTDAVGALVNIVALPTIDDVMVMMRNAGWKTFSKHKDLLLTLSVGTAHDDDDSLRDSTSSGGKNGDDMLAVLELAGICPELSTLLVSPESRLGAFSLLVGHILIMPHNSDRRRYLVQHLGDAYTMLADLMNEVVEMLPLNVKLNTYDYKVSNITRHGEFCDSMLDLASQHVSHNNNDASCLFAEHVYGGALCALPASCRTWYTDLRDRSLIASLDRYTAAFVTPQLIAEQVGVVVEAASHLNDEKFSVKASIASQEVVASLDVEDGHRLELTIKMPSSMPLKAPEARCSKSVGVSESRLRKWLISIAVYLRAQNGTLVDAMLLWKRNVDRQFEGQEECLICYAIIQPANGQLPKLHCRTCRKRFHGQCLYKWFKSSGKSNCPHCQSPW